MPRGKKGRKMNHAEMVKDMIRDAIKDAKHENLDVYTGTMLIKGECKNIADVQTGFADVSAFTFTQEKMRYIISVSAIPVE